MKMYRAITRDSYQKTQGLMPRFLTPRLPSNVPYVVDNLWEHLRPETFPSRRHAIYASPTASLALLNASSGAASRDDYVVCEVSVEAARIRIAHLQVTDARNHDDIRMINQFVSRNSQRLLDEARDPACQFRNAAIFAPGVGSPLNALCIDDRVAGSFADDLIDYAKSNSTFWADASSVPADHDGELFFEILQGDSYHLRLIVA
ncbi:hypothetical protein RYA05_13715 [Pseudomonas syringae pv. actinidiae]|nr:hypothetical protein [Pseudomonas syringae pv. actinidiae]